MSHLCIVLSGDGASVSLVCRSSHLSCWQVIARRALAVIILVTRMAAAVESGVLSPSWIDSFKCVSWTTLPTSPDQPPMPRRASVSVKDHWVWTTIIRCVRLTRPRSGSFRASAIADDGLSSDRPRDLTSKAPAP